MAAVAYHNKRTPARLRFLKVSAAQREYLLDFMEKHLEFSAGKQDLKSKVAAGSVWLRLKRELDARGPPNEVLAWKRVWLYMQKEAKKRLKLTKKAGQKPDSVLPTNEDKRMLEVIKYYKATSDNCNARTGESVEEEKARNIDNPSASSSDMDTEDSSGVAEEVPHSPHVAEGAPHVAEGASHIAEGASQGVPPVAEGAPHIAERAPCVTEGAPHVAEGIPYVTEGTPHVTEGTRCVTEGIPHVTEGAPSVARGISSVSEEVPSIAEEVPSVAEEVPPAAEEVQPVAEEVPPVAEEVMPVAEEVTPVAEEVTPVTEEVTPVAEEVSPVAEEVPPVAEEVPPVAEEVPPVAEEILCVAEEVPPVAQEVSCVTEQVSCFAEDIPSVTDGALTVARCSLSISNNPSSVIDSGMYSASVPFACVNNSNHHHLNMKLSPASRTIPVSTNPASLPPHKSNKLPQSWRRRQRQRLQEKSMLRKVTNAFKMDLRRLQLNRTSHSNIFVTMLQQQREQHQEQLRTMHEQHHKDTEALLCMLKLMETQQEQYMQEMKHMQKQREHDQELLLSALTRLEHQQEQVQVLVQVLLQQSGMQVIMQ